MNIFDDSRASWGAAPNANPRPVPAAQRLGISWHYDGGSALRLGGRAHSACLVRVKGDQTFHQSPARGWADIGYNLLVCQHGRVIEGRGADLQGAHSPGVNHDHYGVQFMVGGTEAPSAAAYARAIRLGHELAAHSGHNLRQWGHKDDPAASTECPGSGIEAWVKRQGVATLPVAAPSRGTTRPPLGRPNIKVANLRRGLSNADVRLYNELLWKAQGPLYKARNLAAWMREPAVVFGAVTERVTFDTYTFLHRKDPKTWGPAPSRPVWPGPQLIRLLGGNPV